MASSLFCSCSLQYIGMAVVFLTSSGAAKSTPAFAAVGFSASMDSAKLFFDDAWVDTQITSFTPSLCKNLNECGRNKTVIAYADILADKQLLFSEDKAYGDDFYEEDQLLFSEDTQVEANDVAHADLAIPAAPRESVFAASAVEDEHFIMETHAVRLSLLLERSCTVSGPRQCGQTATQSFSSGKAVVPRELRPMTISFGRPGMATHNDPASTEAPLITSMRHFRFGTA